jgi:hypothetical protein
VTTQGKAYQNAVAEVMKALEPGASVQENEWITGPDGERECDVTVRGTLFGEPVLVLIECKDWKKNIPPEVIDALDSKSQDMGAHLAIICSNSDFSSTSLKKAGRKGILAVSVLKSGDLRVRTSVKQRVDAREFTLYGLRAEAETTAGDKIDLLKTILRCAGEPVANWIWHELQQLLKEYPNANHLVASFSIAPTATWSLTEATVQLRKIKMEVLYQFVWKTQKVEISADSSLYDHVCSRISAVPNSSFRIHIDDSRWKKSPNQNLNPDAGLEDNVTRLIIHRVGIPQILSHLQDATYDVSSVGATVLNRQVVIGSEQPPAQIRRKRS